MSILFKKTKKIRREVINPIAKKLPELRRSIALVMVVLVTLIIATVLDNQGAFDRIENMVFDSRVKMYRSDKVLPDEIKVVLIDEYSLQTMDPILGNFPWPRSVYADVLDFMAMGGAKAVIFDILLTETERDRAAASQLSASDVRLVEASEEYGNAYHAAMFLNESKEIISSSLNRPLPQIFRQKFQIDEAKGFKPDRHNDFVLPFKQLYESTPHIGIVSLDPDLDGIYRRINFFWEYQGDVFPSLSAAPVLNHFNSSSASISEQKLYIAGIEVPVDENEAYLVNYYGDYKPYSMAGLLISMIKIQKGEIEDLPIYPDEFFDKIVYIGASAIGLDDIKATPADPKSPGVFIHSSAAGNIISNDILQPANNTQKYAFGILFSILTTLVMFKVQQFSIQFLLPTSLVLVYWYWTSYMQSNNVIYPVIFPLVVIFLSWIGSFSYLSFTEGADKRRVKKMLSQYVSPEIMDEAMNSPTAILHAQVGQKEFMSVLFSDVRNFTNISENLPAEKVVQLLNCHFKEMTDAIFDYQGTLDKFIGDALMAFWGAPIYVENHPDLSVQSAMRMISQMKVVNSNLAEMGLPSIDIGIGINSGNVILGNIGSDRKLDYTVIGDSVNLASRLEGITKVYGVKIVISEYTYNALTIKVPCVLLDKVRVKGRSDPIAIYAPLGTLDDTEEQIKEHESVVEKALQAFTCYQSQQWDQAISILESLPMESFKKLYLERCHQYKLNSPADDWDGVYNLLTK